MTRTWSASPGFVESIRLGLRAAGLLHHVQVAADSTHVDVERVLGRERYKSVALARHRAWLAIRRAGLSYPEIASLFGGYDHTSVMSGCAHAAREEGVLACAPPGRVVGEGSARCDGEATGPTLARCEPFAVPDLEVSA